MPNLDKDPKPEPKLFPGRFKFKEDDKPIAESWIYTDVPGDNVFKLDNRWKTDDKGVINGKLIEEQEYNFWYDKAKRDKAWLEGKLTEADCEKIKAPKANEGVIEVKLTKKDTPVVFIPLGDKGEGSESEQWFKCWVPTNHGGTLTFKHDSGGTLGSLSFKEKDKPIKDGPAEQDKAKLEWEVKDGHGWYLVKAVGVSDHRVSADFVQNAIARDGSDESAAPLIPQHFWYWSNSHFAAGVVAWRDSTDPRYSAYKPFHHYDKKFPGKKSLEWEKDPLNGHFYLFAGEFGSWKTQIVPADGKVKLKKGFYKFKCENDLVWATVNYCAKDQYFGLWKGDQIEGYLAIEKDDEEVSFRGHNGTAPDKLQVKVQGISKDYIQRGSKKYHADKDIVAQWRKAKQTAPDKNLRLDDPSQSWTGHCHNSAPATILFKGPKGDPDFPEEDKEHLCAEYFGDFGVTDSNWSLGDTYDRGSKHHKTRPGDGVDAQKFLGSTAAKFHETLRNVIKKKFDAVMIDMRASFYDATTPSNAYVQVWNQATYAYRAEFKQKDAKAGEAGKDAIHVENHIFANGDMFTSEGYPAQVEGNDLKRGADGTPVHTSRPGRMLDSQYVMHFSAGEIQAGNAENAWLSHTNLGSAEQIYPPRFMISVRKPLSARNPNGDGNNEIDLADMKTLGIDFRDKYK